MADRRGRMLVVDDDLFNRRILATNLEDQGYLVQAVENGRHALELLRSEPFDLVLLDVMMPGLDGYQVLTQIVSDIHLREIPVIMISALEEIESVAKCIEMGAEDYLFKPFNPTLLKARINACLEKKRLREQQRELFSKFAPKQVAKALLEEGFTLGGKRVEATVSFADIRSFTSITESQPPEETMALLNSYYRYTIDAVAKENGVVSQMMGDGFMAIFGAPLPFKNHREQAVLSALEMLDLVTLFNQEQKAAGKVEISIGVGIASGEMIAGYIGTEDRATYTCVGDAVNLAARLEKHTKVIRQPILIDENTRRGLNLDIPVREHGTVRVRGKSQTVQVFSVSCPNRI